MHINQLIYFSKVVEAGSIHVAAQKLHISQPALSKSIKELEEELGQTLFIRTNRGVKPTKMGEKVYSDFQSMSGLINSWYATGVEHELVEQIHVSCIHSASSMLLNQIVLPFSKAYPKIDVVVQNQFVTEIFNTIKNSPVNIAITSLPQLEEPSFMEQARHKNLTVRKLFKGTRCLIMSTEHPLAAKEHLTQSDLQNLSLATYSTPNDRPAEIYASYFRNVYKLANKESIMELVLKQEAVWLPVQEMMQGDYYIRNQLIKSYAIPIPDINHTVVVVAVASADLSAGEQLFADYLYEHFSIDG